MFPITAASSGVLLRLHVQPRASRTEVIGLHGDAVKVRLAAPPVDGAANDELVRFLARTLGVPSGAVTIVAGASGRRKQVMVAGIDVAHSMSRLLGSGTSDSG
ncbi:MAG TPA: DUF167 family protein [Gemmatimonadales bacterium]|nr:DUF167 family protein [Gemmatimonadales bacterium]